MESAWIQFLFFRFFDEVTCCVTLSYRNYAAKVGAQLVQSSYMGRRTVWCPFLRHTRISIAMHTYNDVTRSLVPINWLPNQCDCGRNSGYNEHQALAGGRACPCMVLHATQLYSQQMSKQCQQQQAMSRAQCYRLTSHLQRCRRRNKY